ncbi:MAG TPA: glutathione S-transferase, partial [Alphaproteobacteria bacterium]|nr:glutathione S-transferase [Alphaproteobacteria bacterium]
WSLRAWLVLRHFGIPFEEELALLSGEGWKQNLIARSPTGQVPVLIDGDLSIPETLAIIEYIAETYPEVGVWPVGSYDRALARAAAAEMHAGFGSLRAAAPMNLRASHPGRVDLDRVAGDLKRLEALWGGLLGRSGGPYLFGAFTAADAMYAPVATRIRTYDLPVSDTAARYVEAIYALPAFQEWLAEALKEPWIVDEDEIDVIQGLRTPGAEA